MKRSRRLATVGLIVMALSGCGAPAGNNDDAARQFLTERNGGTPVAVSGDGPVVGMIERIDGETITVKSPLQGVVSVPLTPATQVLKQAEVKQSAISVGAQMTAFGTQTTDTLAAEVVQLGDGGLLGGGSVVQAGGNETTRVGPPAAEPGASGSADLVVGGDGGSGPVSGTVTAIDVNKLTIKRADGSLAFVQLNDTTKVYQQTQADRSELQTGTFVAVTGQSIEILPPPTQG